LDEDYKMNFEDNKDAITATPKEESPLLEWWEEA
jgi:hypothetical protein